MRGDYQEAGDLFSSVSPEQPIPRRHLVRKIRKLVDEALTKVNRRACAVYRQGLSATGKAA
jgi:hypothetical protein